MFRQTTGKMLFDECASYFGAVGQPHNLKHGQLLTRHSWTYPILSLLGQTSFMEYNAFIYDMTWITTLPFSSVQC